MNELTQAQTNALNEVTDEINSSLSGEIKETALSLLEEMVKLLKENNWLHMTDADNPITFHKANSNMLIAIKAHQELGEIGINSVPIWQHFTSA